MTDVDDGSGGVGDEDGTNPIPSPAITPLPSLPAVTVELPPGAAVLAPAIAFFVTHNG